MKIDVRDINFKLELKESIRFEFETMEGLYIDEAELEADLFIMDIERETNEVTVYVGYYDDYDVLEEVTYLFENDIDRLSEFFINADKQGQVEDKTKDYYECQSENEYENLINKSNVLWIQF